MEQQGAAGGAERQVSKLVEDHQVGAHESLGNLPRLALRLLLFERVDEVDRREEPDLLAVMLDRLDAEGGRDMRFPRPWPADQDDIVSPVDKLAAVELAYLGFADLAGTEVEPGNVLAGREARSLHVAGDGADLAFRELGLQQLRQDWGSIVGKTIPRIVF